MSDLTTYRPAVVSLATDAQVTVAIRDAVQACGGRAVVVVRVDEFVNAVDRWFPVLALLDMEAASSAEWTVAVRRCKVRPQTRGVPIYGYARTLDEALSQDARDAGVDVALATADLLAEPPSVVNKHINPPTRYPDGWDDALTAKARAGLILFNEGDYFEQHELLEEAWLAEERPIREMYQGILQIGVAFLQIERNNWAGTLKMFRRGLPKLRGLPDVCQGVQVGALQRRAEQIHWDVTQLGSARLAEFDQTQLPQIGFDEEKER